MTVNVIEVQCYGSVPQRIIRTLCALASRREWGEVKISTTIFKPCANGVVANAIEVSVLELGVLDDEKLAWVAEGRKLANERQRPYFVIQRRIGHRGENALYEAVDGEGGKIQFVSVPIV